MTSQGHLERADGRALFQAAAQAPATQPTGEGIQDDCQVDEAATEPDIGDVSDPDLIGAGNAQAFDQVSLPWQVVLAVGGDYPHAPG